MNAFNRSQGLCFPDRTDSFRKNKGILRWEDDYTEVRIYEMKLEE